MPANLPFLLYIPILSFIVFQYAKVIYKIAKTMIVYRNDPHEALTLTTPLIYDSASLVIVTTVSKIIGF